MANNAEDSTPINPGVPLTIAAFAKLQGRTEKAIQNECDKGYWPTVQFCSNGIRFINVPLLMKMCAEAEHKAII